jgi:hypothetical protein
MVKFGSVVYAARLAVGNASVLIAADLVLPCTALQIELSGARLSERTWCHKAAP